jgi:hypothetical protein
MDLTIMQQGPETCSLLKLSAVLPSALSVQLYWHSAVFAFGLQHSVVFAFGVKRSAFCVQRSTVFGIQLYLPSAISLQLSAVFSISAVLAFGVKRFAFSCIGIRLYLP